MASLLILFAFIFVSSSQKILIDTNYGTVAGFQVGNMYKFMNIPFAQPPLNELRFMPPQPLEPWDDNTTWDGIQYGKTHFDGYAPACVQEYIGSNSELIFGPFNVTEDCLYLNVFTPMTASEDNNTSYAVMIWIYGGSFVSGWSAGGVIYDPTETIDYIEDIIIVSINYRIGLLGALYDTIYGTGIEGNQGYMDQKMAIEWVYENIAYFGGDPNRITVYGESAGAHSVALHLLYNNEYIYGGIMESAPLGLPLRDPDTWLDVPQQLSYILECSTANETDPDAILECWQMADWYDILIAQRNKALVENFWFSMPFTPTVNTDLIPYQPVEAFMNSSLSAKAPPFIIGVNRDESNAFLNVSQEYTYESVYYIVASSVGTDNADIIFDYYEIDDMNATDLSLVWAQISTDSWFRCATRNTTMNAINDAWYYHFDVVDTALYQLAFPGRPACYNATCHTAELFYVFLPRNVTQFFQYDNETLNIGHQLQTYWTNFAKTMNPNDGKEVWMDYETNSEQILKVVDDTFNHSIYVDEAVCDDLWDRIGYAGNYCTDCKLNTMDPTIEPTLEPTEPQQKPTENVGSPNNKKLSTGAIIGIVVGGVVAGVLIAYVIGRCVFGNKRPYKKDEVLMADRTNYRALADN